MNSRPQSNPLLRPALLAAMIAVGTPVVTSAADATRTQDDARREAEAEARRIDSEARRAQDDARREMAQRERDQREALRGQDEAIRRLEEARRRLEDNSREVADLSSQLGRNITYSYSTSIGGPSPRAVLGVMLRPSEKRDGAYVGDVSPGGAAEEAGIKAGDLITHIAGLDLSQDSDPQRAVVEKMRGVDPGAKVQVSVLRDGRKMNFDVVARAAPSPQVAPLPPLTPFSQFGATGARPLNIQVQELRDRLEGTPGAPGNVTMRVGPGAMGAFPQMIDMAEMNRLNGMEFATLSDRLGSYFGVKSGVLVVRAGADAPYTLQDGDVILSIDGREPGNAQHAGRILRSYQPGEKVKLRVQRDRKAVNLDAVAPGRRNE